MSGPVRAAFLWQVRPSRAPLHARNTCSGAHLRMRRAVANSRLGVEGNQWTFAGAPGIVNCSHRTVTSDPSPRCNGAPRHLSPRATGGSMNLTISGHHLEVTPSLRNYVTSK